MTFLIYTLICLCLILAQTVILPFFFHVVNSYDLILMFILYLGFYRPALEALPVLLLMGCLMDCLSGGAFGIHTTTYVWLYAVMRGTIQYLHVNSLIVLPVVILTAVLLENLVVLLTVFLGSSGLSLAFVPLKIFVYQLFWALVTGPVIFLGIKAFHQGTDQWFRTHFGRDKIQSDFSY